MVHLDHTNGGRREVKVAIHQPNYLPGLNGKGSFWRKAQLADVFILFDTIQFSPHSFTQRAKLPSGRDEWLTVPVKRPHMQLIKDMEIDWRQYRPRKHIATMEAMTTYRNQLDPYIDALKYAWSEAKVNPTSISETQIKPEYLKLANFNRIIINELASSFGFTSGKFRLASRLLGEETLVNAFNQEAHLFWLLTLTDATEYLTGPSWRKYAPNLEKVLNSHGIKLTEIEP
jgi:hypothetical protein